MEDPEVVIELGLKLAVTPWGNPFTLNVMFPLKPPEGVTLMLYWAELPGATVWEKGTARSEKSGWVVS